MLMARQEMALVEMLCMSYYHVRSTMMMVVERDVAVPVENGVPDLVAQHAWASATFALR